MARTASASSARLKRLTAAIAAVGSLLAAPSAAYALDAVTIAPGGNPDLSGDGSALVFESSKDLDARDEDGQGGGDNDGGGTFTTVPGSGTFTRVATYIPREHRTDIVQGYGASLSDSGSIVGLYSGADLTGGDGTGGIFAANLATGGKARLDSGYGNGVPEIGVSADGSTVVWDLMSGNGPTASFKSYWAPAGGGAPQPISDGAFDPQVSGDGHFVVFTRMRTPGFSQDPKDYEVWLRDLRTGALEQISRNGKDEPASGFGASISADGRYIAFRSIEELTPGSTRYLPVYVYDREQDSVAFVSTTPKDAFPPGLGRLQGSPSPYTGFGTRISNDGGSVAFKTYAPLHPDDTDQFEDLYVKNRDTEEVVRVPLGGAELLGNWFALSGDGTALTWAIAPNDGEPTVFFMRLAPAGQRCPVPTEHRERNLTRIERELVLDSLRRSPALVERARKALQADSRKHPRNRKRNAQLLRELSRYVRSYPPQGSASDETESERLVADAKCLLLDAAEKSLDDSLERYGHADKKRLLLTLSTLRAVLKNEADEDTKQELLKEHVGALIDLLGGDGAAKKYGEVVTDIYDLVKAQLQGTLDKEKRKKLKAKIVKVTKKVAQKFFGEDAPELVDQLLTLRDVIAGDRDPKKLELILKNSISLLAKKLLVGRVMSLPQLRAAMLGFELGQPFGKRISADLDLIANKYLVRACAEALSRKQGGGAGGLPDYSVPTVAVVRGDQWYGGWTCTILTEAITPGYGGLVQAQKPGNENAAWWLLWQVTSKKPVVIFDPRFSA